MTLHRHYYYHAPQEHIDRCFIWNPFAAYRFANYLNNKGFAATVEWTWDGFFVKATESGNYMHLKGWRQ